MAQSVSVAFRIDAELKENVEAICQDMGLTFSAFLLICCKKIEQERRIPFEIRADPDPFYSESNMRELKLRIDAIEKRMAVLEEHELIETEN